MRICLLSERYAPDMGGLAQIVARHARALAQAGHDVHVCVPSAGLLPDSVRTHAADGVTVHRMGMQKQWRDTLTSWSKHLVSLDRELCFDLFHGYTITYAGFVATYLGRFCGKRSLVSAVRADVGPLVFDANVAPLVFKTLEWADMLTASSDDLAQRIRVLSGREEIPVLHNSVDADLFKPQTVDDVLRMRLGLDENVVLGFVGEATAEKGLNLLLRAFARVAAQVPAHLVLVGGVRAQDQRAMDLFESTYPHLSIRKIPYQAHAAMPAYYALMDLVLIPSHRDGLPNILLEAMACERTVIATMVGGIEQVITHGQDGWLVPPGDEDGFVQALFALSQNAEKRQEMGARARESILARYTCSIELDTILGLYGHLLKQ